MDTIDTTILVEDTNGKPLLWLETDANGNTKLNDVSGRAVQRWMLGCDMKRWPFTVTWFRDDLRPGDWETWCKDDFRIDIHQWWVSMRESSRCWTAHLDVWGFSREYAYDYLVNRIEPGMLIKDEDEDEDEDEDDLLTAIHLALDLLNNCTEDDEQDAIRAACGILRSAAVTAERGQ